MWFYFFYFDWALTAHYNKGKGFPFIYFVDRDKGTTLSYVPLLLSFFSSSEFIDIHSAVTLCLSPFLALLPSPPYHFHKPSYCSHFSLSTFFLADKVLPSSVPFHSSQESLHSWFHKSIPSLQEPVFHFSSFHSIPFFLNNFINRCYQSVEILNKPHIEISQAYSFLPHLHFLGLATLEWVSPSLDQPVLLVS